MMGSGSGFLPAAGSQHHQPGGSGSGAYTHRPKLEDDYRNKNIHKVKRMHGSNVVSPGTEKALLH